MVLRLGIADAVPRFLVDAQQDGRRSWSTSVAMSENS
jgi:hypothetical protein